MIKKKSPILLIDADQTIVNMLPTWLEKYNKLTGEKLKEENITDYELRNLVEKPELFDKILTKRNFFFELEPIKDACKYFDLLIKNKYDIVIVTQPPRKASLFSVRDKREWIKKYLPDFELFNIIFTHRKDLIRGDVLFDDSPHHIATWSKKNPNKIIAKIEYSYNKDCKTNWTFKNKDTAWKEFYGKIRKHFSK